MTIKVVPGRNDEIRRRAIGGESLDALALAFGLSRKRISQILENAAQHRGTQGAAERRAYRAVRDKRIVALLREGKGASEVARLVECTEGSVRNVALREGIRTPKTLRKQLGAPTQTPDGGMSPAEAMAYLDRVVAREVMLKWMQLQEEKRNG